MSAVDVPDQRLPTATGEAVVRWRPLPFRPPGDAVSQAYGMCVTGDGHLVLVNHHAGSPYWNLPGGQLEPGETAEQALVREVAEEACARVLDCCYLGCQEIIGEHPAPHFQTRFWARVALDAWEPHFEIVARRLVPPEEFLDTLAWGTAPTAPELLRLTLAEEARRRTGP